MWASELALLALDLLLGSDCAAAWTLTGTCVGVGALSTNRQIAAMTNSAIRLHFDQPADVHLNFLAEIAFHAAFLLDGVAKLVDFIFCQIADFFGEIHTDFFRQPLGAHLSDAIDRGQADPKTFVDWKIHTCDTCHDFSCSAKSSGINPLQKPKSKAPRPGRGDYKTERLPFALLVFRVDANY